MDEKLGMNRNLGIKWFTFYTKVRPWFLGIFALVALADFFQDIHIYLNNLGLLAACVAQIVGAVLSVSVAVKAEEDYESFVSFVKGVLIFEVINVAYQSAAQQYYQNGSSIVQAAIIFVIILLLNHLVWYRLNIKYFRKRLLHATDAIDITNNNGDGHCGQMMPVSDPLTKSVSVVASPAQEEVHINAAGDNTDSQTEYPSTPIDQAVIPNKSIRARQESCATTMREDQNKTSKVRYCKFCGAVIDRTTKVCTGCGKQYFKGIKISKFSITVIASVIIIVSLSALCISQYIGLREQEEFIDALLTGISERQNEIYENQEKIDFFDEYAVIVPDDNTGLYHKWGCSRLDTSYFWIYNTEAAVGNGYHPCPYCN